MVTSVARRSQAHCTAVASLLHIVLMTVGRSKDGRMGVVVVVVMVAASAAAVVEEKRCLKV